LVIFRFRVFEAVWDDATVRYSGMQLDTAGDTARYVRIHRYSWILSGIQRDYRWICCKMARYRSIQ